MWVPFGAIGSHLETVFMNFSKNFRKSKKDQEKLQKRSSKHDSRMKAKNRLNTQGIKRRFSAPSPQDLRTISAGSPLIIAEKVWRTCGDGAVNGGSIY